MTRAKVKFPVNVTELIASRSHRAEEGDFVLVRVIELWQRVRQRERE